MTPESTRAQRSTRPFSSASAGISPWAGPLAAALIAASGGAHAQAVRPDPDSIFTVQVENDAVSTLKGTSDQYYTSGLRLGWTSGADALEPVASFGHDVWGGGTTRVSIDITQSLFTPRDTQIDPPNPADRPYAGELLATLGLIHDSADTRDVVALSLGVVGPSALGEEVQNGFHNIIGDTPNRGWHYQVQDQPAVNLLVQRTWRLPVATLGPIETDILPSATAALGDVRDYVQFGGQVRFGQGLGSDYGTARIEPGLNGSDAYTNTTPIAWYGFAGVDGQAVGYDVSLDGSAFRSDTPSVHRTWDVGEFEAGLAVLVYGLRVTYTQTWQTQEFKGAKAGLFNFGSLALSTKF
jgi:lipid A 3-O-deacylase